MQVRANSVVAEVIALTEGYVLRIRDGTEGGRTYACETGLGVGERLVLALEHPDVSQPARVPDDAPERQQYDLLAAQREAAGIDPHSLGDDGDDDVPYPSGMVTQDELDRIEEEEGDPFGDEPQIVVVPEGGRRNVAPGSDAVLDS